MRTPFPHTSITELYNRTKLKTSKRISNPGCFSTNTQLLLAPLLPYMSAAPSVFAISGYSGAGTKSGKEPKISPESLGGAVRPYSLTDHIHEREASHHLSTLLDFRSYAKAGPGSSNGNNSSEDGGFKVAFVPHVAPWFQGIISTVSVPLNQTLRASEVVELFEQKYAKERLVQVVKTIPEIKDISGKHGVKLGGFQVHSSGRRVVAVVSCPFSFTIAFWALFQ